jgi:hypothetical protein
MEDMASKSKVDVKKVGDSIFLFYDGINCNVGWRLAHIDLWFDEYELMKAEFPLLDLIEEYRLVTEDVLINVDFLSDKDRAEASKKFIKYLTPKSTPPKK